jgi:hypothetical protein
MIRRLPLALIPCAAVFTIAVLATATARPESEPSAAGLEPVEQVAAARSGYIVASS